MNTIALAVRPPLLISLLLLLSAVLGCAASVRPVVTGQPPAPSDSGLCLSADPKPLVGSCGQRWTSQGYACALCNDRGCVDANTFTYCVTTEMGCDDPACGVLARGAHKLKP